MFYKFSIFVVFVNFLCMNNLYAICYVLFYLMHQSVVPCLVWLYILIIGLRKRKINGIFCFAVHNTLCILSTYK